MRFFGTYMTPAELGEVQAMEKLIREESFKVNIAKANTAFVHQGQDYVKTLEGIIRLMRNERENYIAKVAHRLGFTGAISLDMETGRVWAQEPKKDDGKD